MLGTACLNSLLTAVAISAFLMTSQVTTDEVNEGLCPPKMSSEQLGIRKETSEQCHMCANSDF